MENFHDIPISSRIRLARNVSGFNFFTKLTNENDAEFILSTVKKVLVQFGNFDIIRLRDLPLNECKALLERHIISRCLIENKDISAVALSSDEHLVIMMNEEDHIREQCLCEGFNLFKPYREIKSFDRLLLSQVDVAYSDDYGFLTTSPSNLGTGMRASVMLFLPALERSGDINFVRKEVRAFGNTVRGLYGEGSGNFGSLYQISNQNSLGRNEQEILDEVSEYVCQICEMEYSAREDILAHDHDKLMDEIFRAYGVLKNCRLLGEKEMLEKLSLVRFGDALGFLKISDIKAFDKLAVDASGANLEEISDLSKEFQENRARSEFIVRKIGELVEI